MRRNMTVYGNLSDGSVSCVLVRNCQGKGEVGEGTPFYPAVGPPDETQHLQKPPLEVATPAQPPGSLD